VVKIDKGCLKFDENQSKIAEKIDQHFDQWNAVD
jgi:hypothetical protein